MSDPAVFGTQSLLFPLRAESEHKYSAKIEAPVYEPSHDKPHVMTLCDQSKVTRLLREIDGSAVPDEDKTFLRAAAWRHAVFHYERIADYYAHASPEVQRLMEMSALVIIDFNRAIERGYVKLCDDIRQQYLEEYTGDADAS
jgi:hypothetical protein